MLRFLRRSDRVAEKIKATLHRLRPKQLLDMIHKITSDKSKQEEDSAEEKKVEKQN